LESLSTVKYACEISATTFEALEEISTIVVVVEPRREEPRHL
jgi:hypothetical protein